MYSALVQICFLMGNVRMSVFIKIFNKKKIVDMTKDKNEKHVYRSNERKYNKVEPMTF